jgi:hypothetical protein
MAEPQSTKFASSSTRPTPPPASSPPGSLEPPGPPATPTPSDDPQSTSVLSTVLLFDTENGVRLASPKRQPIDITPALARLFVRAARASNTKEPPLSFSSLLGAMLVEPDTWLRRHLAASGADLAAIESHRPFGKVVPGPADESRLEGEYLATVSARSALEEAVRIARASAGNSTVDQRHLCAAYPVIENWHLEDFSKFRIDRLRWAREFGAEMAERFPLERDYWSSYADRASPVPLTSFSADVYTEEDLLGIDRSVDALALLLASTRTVTPLAIGVFGPWGSGKTFYMRHLQRRVLHLRRSEQPRIEQWKKGRGDGSARPDDVPLYFDQIAQVEFNAWHYNEANLVASLIEHLFRNLRVTPNDSETELGARRAAMLGQLNGLKGDLSTIDETLQKARFEVGQAQSKVEQATQAAAAAQMDVRDKAGEITTHQTELQRERDRMDEALRKVNLEAYQVTAEDVIAVALDPFAPILKEVRDGVAKLKNEAFSWRTFFGLLFSGKGLLVVLLCLAAPTLLWLADLAQAQWAALGGFLSTSMVGFWKAIEVLRKQRTEFEVKLQALEREGQNRADTARERLQAEHAQKVAAAQQRIALMRQDLEAQRQTLAKREAQFAQAASELAARTAEHDARVVERTKAEEAVRVAQAKLDQLSSALLLEEFITDRARTDDYRKQLGFLALVRRDVERLSQLIDQANRSWLDPNDSSPAPQLNRIVLYIDDLDRCKESTVLAVLEAVHLLLAFPLFVCAVAVDPRWVEKCLRLTRRQLFISTSEPLAEEPETATAGQGLPTAPRLAADLRDEQGPPATVADYLEKIFQIPIWMSPIAPRARASLVNSLLGPTAAPPVPNGTGAPGRTDTTGTTSPAQAPAPVGAFQSLVERGRAAPDPLRVTPEEAACITELASMLSDRPRALKRLVNVYRLLKASLPDIERESFVSPSPSSGHRICLLQLALFTGHPRVAPALLANMEPRIRGSGTPIPGGQTMEQWFKAVQQPLPVGLLQMRDLLPDWRDLEVAEFQRWLPYTSRYLFNRAT